MSERSKNTSIAYIQKLITKALVNKIEYVKVDGIELKFSPLAFYELPELTKSSNDIREGKNQSSQEPTNSDGNQATKAKDPDVSPFDDIVDEDLLYHSS
jgi:hypothetical protein